MEFEYDNNKYKVSELTVKQLTEGVSENRRQKAVKDAQGIANLLEGKEKIDFLNSVWKSLPTDAEMLETIDKWLGSLDGIKYIIDTAVTPPIEFDVTRVNELEHVIIHALGSFVEKEDPKESKEKEEKEASEAKEASEEVPFGETTSQP